MKIVQRLRDNRRHTFPDGQVGVRNRDGPEAADLIDTLVQALDRATAIIQSERDSVVECATVGPEHDLSTLDPGAEHAVAEFDYDLAHFNAALRKARGEREYPWL